MSNTCPNQHDTTITRKVIVVSTLIISSLAILNTFTLPLELRFERTQYNYLFVIWLSLLLPLSILLTSFVLRNKANRFIARVISVLIALPSLVVFIFASSDYEDIQTKGVDGSFEKIAELEYVGSKYRLYRTNGGATTAFGLVLRKETKLIEGLNTVEILSSQYPAMDGALKIVRGHILQFSVKSYNGEKGSQFIRIELE